MMGKREEGMIRVKLVGGLAEELGKREIEVKYKKGIKVRDVIRMLSHRAPSLLEKFERGEVIASVNYKYTVGDVELKDGDLLILLPEIFGGR